MNPDDPPIKQIALEFTEATQAYSDQLAALSVAYTRLEIASANVVKAFNEMTRQKLLDDPLKKLCALIA